MNDLQKEELRQRLFLVRNRLLQQCSDAEHFRINASFTTHTFKLLIAQANNSDTNKVLSSQKILEILKQDKKPEVQETIEKYGQFFIEEYKHFIRVHNMAFPS